MAQTTLTKVCSGIFTLRHNEKLNINVETHSVIIQGRAKLAVSAATPPKLS